MRIINTIVLLLICTTISSHKLSAQSLDKLKVKIGGALRFNYNHSNWKEGNKKRGGDIGFDVFRLNVNANYNKKLLLDAEYRFYAASSGGGMLKHGWMGYQFNENHQLQLGLTAVPFGIMPYTANNYFFNINYYLGLEDDADLGIKYLYRKGRWDLALAFFKNADILDFSEGVEVSPDRYAYDIAGRNKETNQGNIQLVYHWGNEWKQQLGISAMAGGIYNLDTRSMGSRLAGALHYTMAYGGWNFKAQYTSYRISPRNKKGEARNIITTAAYGSSYEIASKADTYIASLAYTFTLNKGFLNNLQLYNDFSMMQKPEHGFANSLQNITGCYLDMKPVYAYIDYALGKNHAWLGNDWNDAFANGDDSGKWQARFNINIGYYF